jgi:hypothetical protein
MYDNILVISWWKITTNSRRAARRKSRGRIGRLIDVAKLVSIAIAVPKHIIFILLLIVMWVGRSLIIVTLCSFNVYNALSFDLILGPIMLLSYIRISVAFPDIRKIVRHRLCQPGP